MKEIEQDGFITVYPDMDTPFMRIAQACAYAAGRQSASLCDMVAGLEITSDVFHGPLYRVIWCFRGKEFFVLDLTVEGVGDDIVKYISEMFARWDRSDAKVSVRRDPLQFATYMKISGQSEEFSRIED